jgi:hypothetical protein
MFVALMWVRICDGDADVCVVERVCRSYDGCKILYSQLDETLYILMWYVTMPEIQH